MVRVLAVLAAVMLLGGVLRFHAASDPSAYQSKDEQSYAMLARWLAVQHQYGNPGMTDPAHWPPGAPLLFAAAYRLQPEKRGDGVWDVPSAYRVQALVGTLTIPAAFVLALLVAGPLAGLLAAAAVAVYPPLIGASGDLLSEPLGALLLTCALAATVWALREMRPVRLALAGALLGATVLTRADLALVPLVALAVVVVVAWRRAERRPALVSGRAALFMGAATAAVVLPWTIVASNVTGSFVPLSSGGASNLWVGTYLPGRRIDVGAKRALAGEVRARRPDLADRKWFQLRQADVIATVAARRPDLEPEAALAAEARRNLREYALGEPIAFAGMAVEKVRRLWGGYTVGTYRNPRAVDHRAAPDARRACRGRSGRRAGPEPAPAGALADRAPAALRDRAERDPRLRGAPQPDGACPPSRSPARPGWRSSCRACGAGRWAGAPCAGGRSAQEGRVEAAQGRARPVRRPARPASGTRGRFPPRTRSAVVVADAGHHRREGFQRERA